MSKEDITFYKIKELDLDMINPTTKKFADNESSGTKTIVIGKPGCFTKGTKVLMYDGTLKNVEDIKLGEQVMGDDSTPRNVLELCRNNDEMFEIIPIDNYESYTVNKQHKLVLKTLVPFLTYKTNQIYEFTIEEYLKQNDIFKNNMKIFRTVIDFQENNINLENLRINVLEKIPEIYKINSINNRRLFLSNLIDRMIDSIYYDVNKKCLICIFISQDFYNDFVFIAKSIGLLVNKLQNSKNLTISCELYGDLNSLQLKNYNLKNYINSYDLTTSFQIESKGFGDYFGFTLDDNHRFVLGSCDVVRNTGKTTLIASLLYGKKHIFPVAMAMSGSEDSNHFYKQILPSSFVFNDYDPEQVKSFVKRQKMAKLYLENPWAILLLDDCTDDPKIFNSKLQHAIYKKGRHWNMWYILSLQYSMDVKPVIRTNVDGIFILRESILKNRENLWRNYAGIIPDFKLFCTLMDELTDDYTAMYIHNTGISNDWKDCVYWYKAPIIPKDFKLGCKEYWDFHEQRFNENYVDSFDV